jgi:hypothetical protein
MKIYVSFYTPLIFNLYDHPHRRRIIILFFCTHIKADIGVSVAAGYTDVGVSLPVGYADVSQNFSTFARDLVMG